MTGWIVIPLMETQNTRKYLDICGGWGGREKEMKSTLDMFGLSCPRNNSYADVQHVIEYSDSLDNCSANIHSFCPLTVGRIYFCALLMWELMLVNLGQAKP